MKYFGTDGIRQKADKFTPEFLARVVAGLVDYAGSEIRVFLAGDTRESSEWILGDLAKACETFGLEYSLAGVLPTPAINYCFYEMGFDFAIDVTASHNPVADNGIKIFERGEGAGRKLSEKGCEVIERAIAADKTYALATVTDREDLHEEAVERYVEHLKEYVGEVPLTGVRMGMDCANGATSVIAARVFEELGAEVEVICCEAGYNSVINDGCGSTQMEPLQRLVVERGLDCGAAFDGDGDRCLMVDERGEVVDGDQIIAILAENLGLSQITVTVMANQGLLNWAEQNGIQAEVTAVGDANVVAAMREKGIQVGGEQSGHIILPGESTGDGMLTALMVVRVMAKMGLGLAELAGVMPKLPQVIQNVVASPEQKARLKSDDAVKALLLEYAEKLEARQGRLLVRPSGTENLVRITMWGDDLVELEGVADELKNKLGELL